MSDAPDMLAAALKYAERGIPVFSCKKDKTPLTAHGFKDATTDPDQIRKWWSHFPDASIGGVMGAVSGLDVLDVDPAKGGLESLRALETEHGILPKGTPRTKTGGGGMHIFFRHAPQRIGPISGLRPGLDVRADDSYVILPPSGHASGRRYEWTHPLELDKVPEWPGWLLGIIADYRANRSPVEARVDGRPLEAGERNSELVRIAGKLRRAEASKNAILTQLREVNAARCRPPLEDRELEAVARSVGRYSPAKDPQPVTPARLTLEPTPAAAPTPSAADRDPPKTPDVGRGGKRPPEHAEIVAWAMSTYHFAALRDTDELLVYRDGIYVPAGEAVLREAIERLYVGVGTSTRRDLVNETVAAVKRRSGIDRAELNPPELLCLKNGILDLQTLVIKPHSPELRFTAKLPVAFDPKAKCPTWERCLEEWQPDPTVRDSLQKEVGYGLEYGNREQKATMHYGEGCNGKTTFLSIQRELYGPDNVTSFTLQELNENRFAPGHLAGKLANIADDIPRNALRHTGTFKMLVGESAIKGEHKYADPFFFVSGAKAVFACNDFPEVTDDRSFAFWRRWRIYAWTQSFAGHEDHGLADKLRAELPGILNWALDGLRKYRAEGFPEMHTADDAMRTWKQRSDTIFWFLSEAATPDARSTVDKKDLYQAYLRFCDDHAVKPRPDKDFHGRLPTYPGYSGIRQEQPRDKEKGRHRVVVGIRLRERPGGEEADESNDESKNQTTLGNAPSGTGGTGGTGAHILSAVARGRENGGETPVPVVPPVPKPLDKPHIASPYQPLAPCHGCGTLGGWRVRDPGTADLEMHAYCASCLKGKFSLEPEDAGATP